MISSDQVAQEADKPTGICLSVCMIVRDSSRTLGAALESIRPFVDEMIVVDTGSLDETPALAESLGARVFHFPWCDSFSAARNESLRHARGDWLFWMDSDDTIDPLNGQKLRELVERSGASPLAYVMQVHCPGPQSEVPADITVVDHVKLFRNVPEIRFEGRIHEQVLPAIRRLGGEVAWTDLFVTHSGSDQSPAGRSRKQQRDLRLIELELQDHPDHPFALFNLGMTLADMERHEEAVVALRRSLEVATPGESHVRKAYALLVSSLTQLGKIAEAWGVCGHGLQAYADDPELHFRSGMLAHRLGNLDQAVVAYQRALKVRGERYFSSADRGITGYKSRHNLAIVYAEQQRHDLAELQWRLAIEESPGYAAGWRGLGDALLTQRRFTSAELVLEQFPNITTLNSYAYRLRGELAAARGDFMMAEREYKEGAQSFPEDLELIRARCQFLFEHGDCVEAEHALLELSQLAPEDGSTFQNLGMLYHKMTRFSDAVRAFEQSLALRPAHPQTLQCLAIATERAQSAPELHASHLDESHAET